MGSYLSKLWRIPLAVTSTLISSQASLSTPSDTRAPHDTYQDGETQGNATPKLTRATAEYISDNSQITQPFQAKPQKAPALRHDLEEEGVMELRDTQAKKEQSVKLFTDNWSGNNKEKALAQHFQERSDLYSSKDLFEKLASLSGKKHLKVDEIINGLNFYLLVRLERVSRKCSCIQRNTHIQGGEVKNVLDPPVVKDLHAKGLPKATKDWYLGTAGDIKLPILAGNVRCGGAQNTRGLWGLELNPNFIEENGLVFTGFGLLIGMEHFKSWDLRPGGKVWNRKILKAAP